VIEAAPEIYGEELAERISGRWLPLKSATILAYTSCFGTYPGLPL
jgi:hypothetical protein